MKKRIVYYLFILLFSIGFTSCTDHKSKKYNESNNNISDNGAEINGVSKIEFLIESNDSDKFYVITNYKDDENCIKYIFDFAEKEKGWIVILTNRFDVYFDDGVPFYNDKISQRFSFFRDRKSLRNKGITVNFLENIPISFTIKNENNQTNLSADFETLTVNTVQNFLDYAEKDEAKKETATYTYILYNKHNQEKMQLKYHDQGQWFEVEIL